MSYRMVCFLCGTETDIVESEVGRSWRCECGRTRGVMSNDGSLDLGLTGDDPPPYGGLNGDYHEVEQHGRAPAKFANAIAEVVQRNAPEFATLSFRHGVAQGVWNYLCEQAQAGTLPDMRDSSSSSSS